MLVDLVSAESKPEGERGSTGKGIVVILTMPLYASMYDSPFIGFFVLARSRSQESPSEKASPPADYLYLQRSVHARSSPATPNRADFHFQEVTDHDGVEPTQGYL